MAYFKRNGMVLAGASLNVARQSLSPDKLEISDVKYGSHSENAENVKYGSSASNVKYENETQSVKPASHESENTKAIEILFDRLVESLEKKFKTAIENATENLNSKFDELCREHFKKTCNINERNGGEENANCCKPCDPFGVKYSSEMMNDKGKPDFTFPENESERKTDTVLAFPLSKPSSITDRNTVKQESLDSKIRSIALMDDDEEPDRDGLIALERNEGLCNEEENKNDFENGNDHFEDEENYEEDEDNEANEDDWTEEFEPVEKENVNKNETFNSADKLKIAELERELQELKSEKRENNSAKSFNKIEAKKTQEPEEVYRYIESRIIKRIEKDYAELNREYLRRDVYQGLDLEQLQAISWLNIRLRCLIESTIKLTHFSEIDNHTLRCLTDAFIKVFNSTSYQITSDDSYEHKNLIKELCEKLHQMVTKNIHTERFGFKIPRDLKAKLVAIRREMAKHIPLMKFSEMDFIEPNFPLKSRENKNKGAAPAWQERYRTMKLTQLKSAA